MVFILGLYFFLKSIYSGISYIFVSFVLLYEINGATHQASCPRLSVMGICILKCFVTVNIFYWLQYTHTEKCQYCNIEILC